MVAAWPRGRAHAEPLLSSTISSSLLGKREEEASGLRSWCEFLHREGAPRRLLRGRNEQGLPDGGRQEAATAGSKDTGFWPEGGAWKHFQNWGACQGQGRPRPRAGLNEGT